MVLTIVMFGLIFPFTPLAQPLKVESRCKPPALSLERLTSIWLIGLYHPM
jgi:hypothetical protein